MLFFLLAQRLTAHKAFCPHAVSVCGRGVSFKLRGRSAYPFTAPSMVPETRYFCTKGVMQKIGSAASTMHT